MVVRKEEPVIFLISLQTFLSFFVILTFCYLFIVRVNVYCYTDCVERYVGLHSNITPHTERYAFTPKVMLPHHHI